MWVATTGLMTIMATILVQRSKDGETEVSKRVESMLSLIFSLYKIRLIIQAFLSFELLTVTISAWQSSN